MRMGHRFGQRQHRRARHTLGFQRGNGGIAAGKAAEPGLDDVLQRLVVVAARPAVGKARILFQLRPVHGLDHLRPLVRHHHDRDEFVALVAEHAGRPAIGMQRAGALGRELVAAQRGLRDVDFVHGEIGVDQRALDVLPLAGPFAVQQREADRHRRGDPGRAVADGDRQLRRTAVALADRRGDAGIGGAHVVEARLVAERPGLAGQRDRAHHQLRVDAAQVLVAEAGPRHHAGREILHHHVDLRDQ